MQSMAKSILAPEDDYGVPPVKDAEPQDRSNDSKFTHDFRRLSFQFGSENMVFGMASPWPRIVPRRKTKADGKQTMHKKQREEHQ